MYFMNIRKQMRRIKKDIKRFLKDNGLNINLSYKLVNNNITYLIHEPKELSEIKFENFKKFTIVCNREAFQIPFPIYHEIGHIILGFKVHIWYIYLCPINSKNNDYIIKILNFFKLLDLGVDDFLFKKKKELVINYYKINTNQLLDEFQPIIKEENLVWTKIKSELGSFNSVSNFNINFEESLIFLWALETTKIEKYLKDYSRLDEFQKFNKNRLNIANKRVNMKNWIRKYEGTQKILSHYSFKLNTEENIISFLYKLLENFEMKNVKISNNDGFIKINFSNS